MKHEVVEKNVGLLALLMVFAVSIGGLTQIVPLFFQDVTNKPVEGMKPYTALQLEGRDIYIREGCVGCHSQMIRPFRAEPSATATTRWPAKACGTTRSCGAPSAPARTWPASAAATPMTGTARTCTTRATWCRSRRCRPTRGWWRRGRQPHRDKLRTLRTLGVPYTDDDIAGARDAVKGKTEMDALVAYLQVLGTAIKNKR
jgi:cytochrome c oxidase cbb3-type subunit 2